MTTTPRRAAVQFEVNGRPFPLPVVYGTVAGERVLMVLDTGASSHFVAGWFARKIHLPLRSLGDVGTDHVGAEIAAYRIDKPELTIEGWGALPEGPALATEVPPDFEKLGIGAFVSPQQLLSEDEGGAMELDLAHGELRTSSWGPAAGSAAAAVLIEPGTARRCEDDGPGGGLAFVVPAAIAEERVRLLLDTGAQRSDLLASSEAGRKLAAGSVPVGDPLFAVSGRIIGRQLRGTAVRAGSVAKTATVNLVEGTADATCPRDGVLGMDVLRRCTLVFGSTPRRVSGRCE